MVAPNEDLQVNQEMLERYCEELPGARIFLENFFLTAEGSPIDETLQNYVMDVKLYSPTNRTIRENQYKMLQAFADISGESLVLETYSYLL
jgi:hypothetical protein